MIPNYQPIAPRQFVCWAQIRGILRDHNIPCGDAPPAGFPGLFNFVRNGFDATTRRDYDGASEMFARTGYAQAPELGLAYWLTTDVQTWLLAQ